MESWDSVTLRAIGIREPSAAEAGAVNVSTGTNSSASFATTELSGYQFYMVYFNPVTGHVGNRTTIGGRITVSATTTEIILSDLPNLAGVDPEWVKGFGMTNDNGQVPYWLVSALSTATITNTVLTGGVATYTAANTFAEGQNVSVSGTTNGGGVFNTTGNVINPTGTTFQLAIDEANVASAADTGTASVTSSGSRIVAGNTATTAVLTSSVVDFTQELPYRNGVPPPLDKFTKVGSVIFGAVEGDINLHYTENDSEPTASATSANFVGVPAESWSPDNIEPFPTAEVPTCIQTYGGTAGFFYSKNYLAIWALELYQAGQNPWSAVINVGCAGQRAWIDTPYGPIWMTWDKQLMTWNGTGAQPISEEYERSLLGQIGNAYIPTTELAYYRDPELGIDRLYVKSKDVNGNPVIVIHDFRLQDYRNQVAMGYDFLYAGMTPSTFIGTGYTPRQNVRDTNFRERLWTGAADGNFYQLEDGSTSDNNTEYTGDAIALINAGDDKPLLDAIEWQGDGNVEVSYTTKASLSLGDYEEGITEEVEDGNPDNRYQVKVTEEARWVYARFQLTSHPADGNFVLGDPPFVPMPSYGVINGITPKFGRPRPEAP
jgi:hypothetical protein